MKKLLSLLLCLLLLLCGCQESTKTLGEFYENEGVVQNSLVTMVVTSPDWAEPVTEITFTIYNHTDFDISGRMNDLVVKKLENGVWQQLPHDGEHWEVVRVFECAAKGSFQHQLAMKDKEACYPTYQAFLENAYRLRLPYSFCDLPDNIPSRVCNAIGHFTVT